MSNNQIYGSGMIAKAFANAIIPKDVIIVAAGVSNSQETCAFEFEREKKFLESILSKHKNSRIVYFSSCSIYQQLKTPYVNHKLAMEKLIESSATNYYICRLPQVVGLTNNKTIISYFTQSIKKREVIKVFTKAKRSLIDIADVVRIVQVLLSSSEYCCNHFNISNGVKTTVSDIITSIGDILKVKPLVSLVNEGESYDIPSTVLKGILPINDRIYCSEYSKNLLKEYVPVLVSHYSDAKIP